MTDLCSETIISTCFDGKCKGKHCIYLFKALNNADNLLKGVNYSVYVHYTVYKLFRIILNMAVLAFVTSHEIRLHVTPLGFL